MKTPKYFYYILLTIGLSNTLMVNNTSAQSKPHKLKRVTVTHKAGTYKDSIQLNASANLDKEIIDFKDNKTTYAEVVKFTLTITNNSKVSVPDPIAYKGSKFVKLYINGHLNMPKALFDESEDVTDTDKVIETGQSQTFYCDWLKSNRTQLIRKYGKKFAIQFTYLNKRSAKVWVDVSKLKAKS
ncbi:hypothetical protein BEL04_14635 [Mucilaginibacter sp. PPCGB 2223]|uniref:hypothetical protein n=1 Tax=Mucilaginibacter sp. PPCGB 2223 TaxID=1886027 RepID=UPI00082623AB|nr:hypothetical protein [Mucilaginibacter sp. PPCGB 2223]OCX52680.1 hypothetical protein BEL04_14635 [Mucilaginibacter sp. PPCGB 2223]